MTYEDIMKFVKFMVKTSITFKLIFTKVTKSWKKKGKFPAVSCCLEFHEF